MNDERTPADSPDRQPAAEQPSPAAPPARTATARHRTLWIVLGILAAVLFLGALVGVVVWGLNRPGPTPITGAAAVAPYAAAWTSAMKKAGVEATLPAEPTDITALQAAGQHDFSATFTAEEITALVNVYRYAPPDQPVTLGSVSVRFPQAGNGVLRGSAVISGSSYSAELAGPAGYENGSIVPQGDISVSVEGFGVGGERAQQAIQATFDYLNQFLREAPGLTIESAEITAEGLSVTGKAPDVLTNPAPDAAAPGGAVARAASSSLSPTAVRRSADPHQPVRPDVSLAAALPRRRPLP